MLEYMMFMLCVMLTCVAALTVAGCAFLIFGLCLAVKDSL